MPARAEVKKFEQRSGYALLEVVLKDSSSTYKALRITADQLAQIQVIDRGMAATTGSAEDLFVSFVSPLARRRPSFRDFFGNASEVDAKNLQKDLDAEMKIYISGNMNPIEREFKRGADITEVQKTLAQFTADDSLAQKLAAGGIAVLSLWDL